MNNYLLIGGAILAAMYVKSRANPSVDEQAEVEKKETPRDKIKQIKGEMAQALADGNNKLYEILLLDLEAVEEGLYI